MAADRYAARDLQVVRAAARRGSRRTPDETAEGLVRAAVHGLWRTDERRRRPQERAALPGLRQPRERRQATVWTRDRIIGAIRWWNDVYGEPPATPDWNSTQARDFLGDTERAQRFTRLHADGRIPWHTTVVLAFGSWNAAIEAAGFVPRQPNGGGGNQQRRRSVRERMGSHV